MEESFHFCVFKKFGGAFYGSDFQGSETGRCIMIQYTGLRDAFLELGLLAFWPL